MRQLDVDQRALPAAARQAVRTECRQAGTGPECESSAVLLTSEVVTNALIHGAGEVRLAVGVDDRVVRVEVGDDDADHTAVSQPENDDEMLPGGRGLAIVDALSSGWGAFLAPSGKVVWFEVPSQP